MSMPRKPRQSQSVNKPKEMARNSLRTNVNNQVVSSVTQELRHLIATQEIPPGSKLSEVFLSEKYGISRSRVRDVLSTLEQRGLVERIPNRGAIVVRLEISQIFDLYEVREVLEGLCVRLATIRGDSIKWQAYLKDFNGHLE